MDILYRREIAQAVEAKRRADEFREKFASPYVAAELGFIDEVIEPRVTRPKYVPARDDRSHQVSRYSGDRGRRLITDC